MPIRRFESHQAAREALWTTRDDPRLVERIRALWERSHALVPGGVSAPRGVRHDEASEAANPVREAWMRGRVRAKRAAPPELRAGPPPPRTDRGVVAARPSGSSSG